ncbi:MAG: NAD-dependent epimerase/dehydratase family protein [Pseudomonadales bacterium]|nr:NAD-dependent epimerase/dehydratase family protein [Pseudomonadales bacterium]
MSEVEKPEVLITGAGGALAQNVINQLKEQYRVVLVDFRRRVQFDEGMSSYRVEYNKRGFEDIFRKHDIQAVIHLGRMGLYESTHRNRYNHNVLGTQRLLDLCHKYDVHQVIVLSTFFVYGASPYNSALISEDQPLKASELTMDLVDSVELENLANIYLWKYPELNITILRPCNIAGPGVLNSMSLLLSNSLAPVLIGFSPMMQFMHVEDIASAIVVAFKENHPGIYNVASDDWISYQEAVVQCGCTRLPIPSAPEGVPLRISKILGLKAWPSYLINYYKYPVVIDGSLFNKTFNYKPKRSLDDIFSYYREKKALGIL